MEFSAACKPSQEAHDYIENENYLRVHASVIEISRHFEGTGHFQQRREPEVECI